MRNKGRTKQKTKVPKGQHKEAEMAKHTFDSWEEANEAAKILSESKECYKEKVAVAARLKNKAWKIAGILWGPWGLLFAISLALAALPKGDPESGILGKLAIAILSVIPMILLLGILASWIYGFIRLHKEVIAPLGGWRELKIFWDNDSGSPFASKAVAKSAYLAGRLMGDAGTGRVLGFIGLIWKPLWSVQKVWFRLIFPPTLITGYIGRREKQMMDCDKYIRIARTEMTLYEKAC